MLYYIPILFALINLGKISYGVPVENGIAIGSVKKVGGQFQVTRRENYPYVVFVETIEAIGNQHVYKGCTGVIISIKSVLTAAHCIHDKKEPIVFVYAGVIDIEHEEKKAQKIPVKEFQVHQLYQPTCRKGIKYCFENNDIAIMWLQRNFVFGPFVKAAKLNANIKKPINEIGWILGWGRKANNVQTTMLHKGRVQVILQEECETHHPLTHITKYVMCVRGVKKATQTGTGDSGGPLVIHGMVYGICSISLEQTRDSKEHTDVYTDVARYADWIRYELGLEKRECESEWCTIL